jgi:Mrp family chromosome partitioning ATPase
MCSLSNLSPKHAEKLKSAPQIGSKNAHIRKKQSSPLPTRTNQEALEKNSKGALYAWRSSSWTVTSNPGPEPKMKTLGFAAEALQENGKHVTE